MVFFGKRVSIWKEIFIEDKASRYVYPLCQHLYPLYNELYLITMHGYVLGDNLFFP